MFTQRFFTETIERALFEETNREYSVKIGIRTETSPTPGPGHVTTAVLKVSLNGVEKEFLLLFGFLGGGSLFFEEIVRLVGEIRKEEFLPAKHYLFADLKSRERYIEVSEQGEVLATVVFSAYNFDGQKIESTLLKSFLNRTKALRYAKKVADAILSDDEEKEPYTP